MNLTQLFPLAHSWLLLVVFCLALISVILSNGDCDSNAIIVLFLAAFILRLFMAHLDPFLHTWDECFHAVVSRNMMGHPLKPMLVANPV
ncbi:MAG: hypothetical protein ACTHJ0_01775, partial [Flavipsychrobacter sp.]